MADDYMNLAQRSWHQYVQTLYDLLHYLTTMGELMKMVKAGGKNTDLEAISSGIEAVEQHIEGTKKELNILEEVIANEPHVHEALIRQIETCIARQEEILRDFKTLIASNSKKFLSEMMNFLRECEKETLESSDLNSEALKKIRDLIEWVGKFEQDEEKANKDSSSSSTTENLEMSKKDESDHGGEEEKKTEQ